VSESRTTVRRVAGNRPRRRALPGIVDQVQRVLIETPGKALSAYDIAAALQASGRRPYTTQIYKALEQLIRDQRAIHLSSLRKYVAHLAEWPELPILLVCRRCGAFTVGKPEVDPAQLLREAKSSGFHPDQSTLEWPCLCDACSFPDGEGS
jgi:Fe2+ or Zn2+ uptake regulation protein